MLATPLLGRWQPPPLTRFFLSGGFLTTRPSAIPAAEPTRSTRSQLLPALPASSQGDVAAGLLPRDSRWLLSARTRRDEPLSATDVLPPQREPGMPIRRPLRAFEPLLDPDHLSATVLFLSGSVLFLASFLLGMISSPLPQPDLRPPGTDSAPLLPALITSPHLTVPPRSAA